VEGVALVGSKLGNAEGLNVGVTLGVADGFRDGYRVGNEDGDTESHQGRDGKGVYRRAWGYGFDGEAEVKLGLDG
jgi:hypothetical protein